MAGDHLALLENLVAASSSASLSPDLERAAFEATSHVLQTPRPDPELQRLAVQALTNLSDSEERCKTLHEQFQQLGGLCVEALLRSSDTAAASDVFGLLTNLTRYPFWAETIAALPVEKFSLELLLGRSLEGWFPAALPLLLNLTQVVSVRRALCESGSQWLAGVFSCLDPQRPLEQRRLAVGVLKNVAFEDECHSRLVSDDVCFVPTLLRLLVSSVSDPELEIDNEDLEELPASVRDAVRDPKHAREVDEQVRLRAVKTLLQICSTPVGREALLDNNTYIVLRELYKWEGEHGCREVVVAARHVIDVLITEAEPKKEDFVPDYDSTACFRQVEVPEEQVQVVERLDRELLDG